MLQMQFNGDFFSVASIFSWKIKSPNCFDAFESVRAFSEFFQVDLHSKESPFDDRSSYTSGQACFQSKSHLLCLSYNLHVFQHHRDNIIMAVISRSRATEDACSTGEISLRRDYIISVRFDVTWHDVRRKMCSYPLEWVNNNLLDNLNMQPMTW